MKHKLAQIDKSKMRKSFDSAAKTYEKTAVLQSEVADRILQRMDYIKIQPDRILDVGAGTGRMSRAFKKRYHPAQVIALDIAHGMLLQAKNSNGLFKKLQFVEADAESLPFAENSFDLIVSNMTLQWCQQTDMAFQQWRNVLKPNGLLMFTTLGPDTLKELRQSWRAVDDLPHVNDFIDMHDIGDALMRSGFSEPVMDVEYMTLTYDKVTQLLKDLKDIGAHNVLQERSKGLTGKKVIKSLENAYEEFRHNDLLPATYEVIYGHAWILDKNEMNDDSALESYVSVDSIKHN
jgi:malonyl-CoA O-methyltransferase